MKPLVMVFSTKYSRCGASVRLRKSLARLTSCLPSLPTLDEYGTIADSTTGQPRRTSWGLSLLSVTPPQQQHLPLERSVTLPLSQHRYLRHSALVAVAPYVLRRRWRHQRQGTAQRGSSPCPLPTTPTFPTILTTTTAQASNNNSIG